MHCRPAMQQANLHNGTSSPADQRAHRSVRARDFSFAPPTNPIQIRDHAGIGGRTRASKAGAGVLAYARMSLGSLAGTSMTAACMDPKPIIASRIACSLTCAAEACQGVPKLPWGILRTLHAAAVRL